MTINLLFIGDVMGRSGRRAVTKYLPALRQQCDLHLVIANVENSARGFGVTGAIVRELEQAGVDVMTTGNHTWDQREIFSWIAAKPSVLRPINFPAGVAGRGSFIATTSNGARVLVSNAMGRVFMNPCMDDPFAAMEKLLQRYPLVTSVEASLLDFHAESTSEAMAMGHFCDGMMSAVLGTHTHVPTADCMILGSGTGYQSDVGMSGDYDSVIGMKTDEPLKRFRTGINMARFQPATGDATLCAVMIKVDTTSGLAAEIEPVRIGGKLAQTQHASLIS